MAWPVQRPGWPGVVARRRSGHQLVASNTWTGGRDTLGGREGVAVTSGAVKGGGNGGSLFSHF